MYVLGKGIRSISVTASDQVSSEFWQFPGIASIDSEEAARLFSNMGGQHHMTCIKGSSINRPTFYDVK